MQKERIEKYEDEYIGYLGKKSRRDCLEPYVGEEYHMKVQWCLQRACNRRIYAIVKVGHNGAKKYR